MASDSWAGFPLSLFNSTGSFCVANDFSQPYIADIVQNEVTEKHGETYHLKPCLRSRVLTLLLPGILIGWMHAEIAPRNYRPLAVVKREGGKDWVGCQWSGV